MPSNLSCKNVNWIYVRSAPSIYKILNEFNGIATWLSNYFQLSHSSKKPNSLVVKPRYWYSNDAEIGKLVIRLFCGSFEQLTAKTDRLCAVCTIYYYSKRTKRINGVHRQYDSEFRCICVKEKIQRSRVTENQSMVRAYYAPTHPT